MKIKDLVTALEGLDPEMPLCIFNRGTESYLDITGVYEAGILGTRWSRVKIEVEQPEGEE
jgi:hypothetical protein